jgi:hypothetical protein
LPLVWLTKTGRNGYPQTSTDRFDPDGRRSLNRHLPAPANSHSPRHIRALGYCSAWAENHLEFGWLTGTFSVELMCIAPDLTAAAVSELDGQSVNA